MSEVFSDKDRQAAEAKDTYVKLSDGRYYRMKMGQGNLSLAHAIRVADLGQRIRGLSATEDMTSSDLALLYHLLVELLGEVVEGITTSVLGLHTMDELVALVDQYFLALRHPPRLPHKALLSVTPT